MLNLSGSYCYHSKRALEATEINQNPVFKEILLRNSFWRSTIESLKPEFSSRRAFLAQNPFISRHFLTKCLQNGR